MKRGVNMLTIMHADIDTLERESIQSKNKATGVAMFSMQTKCNRKNGLVMWKLHSWLFCVYKNYVGYKHSKTMIIYSF